MTLAHINILHRDFCVDHCISGTQKEGEIQIHEYIKGSRCVWWGYDL